MANIHNNNSTIAVKCCTYTNFKYQTLPNINQIINTLAFSLLYNFTFYQHDFIYLFIYFIQASAHDFITLQNSSLISYIPCLLIDLNCSFMTPKNARLIYFNSLISLHMFQDHLHHPQLAPYQDLKLTKIQQFKK
jgi:hypothetical protein